MYTHRSEPLTTPQQQATQHSTLKMPSQLAQGYTHFNISRLELVMTPLQSLSITYTVSTIHIMMIYGIIC